MSKDKDKASNNEVRQEEKSWITNIYARREKEPDKRVIAKKVADFPAVFFRGNSSPSDVRRVVTNKAVNKDWDNARKKPGR